MVRTILLTLFMGISHRLTMIHKVMAQDATTEKNGKYSNMIFFDFRKLSKIDREQKPAKTLSPKFLLSGCCWWLIWSSRSAKILGNSSPGTDQEVQLWMKKTHNWNFLILKKWLLYPESGGENFDYSLEISELLSDTSIGDTQIIIIRGLS